MEIYPHAFLAKISWNQIGTQKVASLRFTDFLLTKPAVHWDNDKYFVNSGVTISWSPLISRKILLVKLAIFKAAYLYKVSTYKWVELSLQTFVPIWYWHAQCGNWRNLLSPFISQNFREINARSTTLYADFTKFHFCKSKIG